MAKLRSCNTRWFDIGGNNLEKVKFQKEIKKPLSRGDIWEIKEYTNNAFSNIGSESYRQKLVYNLLNTVKISNQNEFFSILLRTLNSQKGKEEIKKLSGKLEEIYPLTPGNFENVAYSIIMGIMSAKSEN